MDESRGVDAAQEGHDPLRRFIGMKFLRESCYDEQDKGSGVQPVFNQSHWSESFYVIPVIRCSCQSPLPLPVHRISPHMQQNLQQQTNDHKRNKQLVAPVDEENEGRLIDIRFVMRYPTVRERRCCPGVTFLAALDEICLDDR